MKRTIGLYKSYVFKERDPIIDAFIALRSEAKVSYSQVQRKGGPAATTLSAWENGKTKRPQHATVAAAASAIGATGIMFGGGKPYFITSVVRKPQLRLISGGRKPAA